MMALVFSNPFLLLGLAGLPVLWWLLRVTPPRPRMLRFPPLRLILDLVPEQKTPARAPWWLTVLRLLIAALVITAAAGPQFNPQSRDTALQQGPLLILFDDGWASAPDWEQRLKVAEHVISQAAQNQLPVALLPFSHPPLPLTLAPASTALSLLKSLTPVAFTPDRHSHMNTITDLIRTTAGLSVLFISDGISAHTPDDTRSDFLATLLQETGQKKITLIMPEQKPWALTGRQDSDTSLVLSLARAQSGKASAFDIVLRDRQDRVLGRKSVMLGAQDTERQIDIPFPLELRRDIARIEIDGHPHAGAVWLSDQGQNRKRVAIISESNADTSKALLSPLTYLTRALSPFAEIRQSRLGTSEAIATLLEEHPAVMILADLGQLPDSARAKLTDYMQDGGIVVRFASPSLARAQDPMVPVPLRGGGRALGGMLAWDAPRALAPFADHSPFAGLPIPPDVVVNRQILAEPAPDLSKNTWAHLVDGTPVVTAQRQGKGQLVLFHVSAEAGWSNLPLSGLFVSMLQKILDLSHQPLIELDSSTTKAERLSAPLRLMDGYGRWQNNIAAALPLDAIATKAATIHHPAGFYGTADAPHALNVLNRDMKMRAFDASDPRIEQQPLDAPLALDLRPWLLCLAALLFLLDGVAVLVLQGALTPRLRAGAVIAVLFYIGFQAAPLHAQDSQTKERESMLATRLAYVLTGDSGIDEFSRLGLTELSAFLSSRTALEPAGPIGVDLSKDELGVYPLLYWPMRANQPTPDARSIARIDAYMKNGGTILFDTRDAGLKTAGGATPAETKALQAILSQIAVPPLEPVPAGHVILKTFFLIDGFVGRYTTGKTFIEASPQSDMPDQAQPIRGGDGVSALLITSNDLAAAWAAGKSGGSLSTFSETMPRQREMALRGGANIVMYVLTGNYKSDQVHVPALLERLGR